MRCQTHYSERKTCETIERINYRKNEGVWKTLFAFYHTPLLFLRTNLFFLTTNLLFSNQCFLLFHSFLSIRKLMCSFQQKTIRNIAFVSSCVLSSCYVIVVLLLNVFFLLCDLCISMFLLFCKASKSGCFYSKDNLCTHFSTPPLYFNIFLI